MEQPNRKGVAAVAAEREPEADEPPTSSTTYLELDEESFNGLRKYAGRFKFTVPTMGDRVDIGVLKAKYTEEMGLDGSPDNIAEALAYLNITLDAEECPQWWRDSKQGIDLYDFPPLLVLYAEARAYEATFLGGRTRSANDASEAEEGPAAAADGSVEPPVQDTPQRRQVLASFGKRDSGADTPDAVGGGAEGRGDREGDAAGSD